MTSSRIHRINRFSPLGIKFEESRIAESAPVSSFISTDFGVAERNRSVRKLKLINSEKPVTSAEYRRTLANKIDEANSLILGLFLLLLVPFSSNLK